MIFRKFLKPIWSTGPSISLSFRIRRKKYFIYLRILWIFGISCMKDLNALRDDLMELKPTLFAGVPRVFEKVHEGKFTHQQKIYIFIWIQYKTHQRSSVSFRYQKSSGRTQPSKEKSFWHALQTVSWYSIIIYTCEYFLRRWNLFIWLWIFSSCNIAIVSVFDTAN